MPKCEKFEIYPSKDSKTWNVLEGDLDFQIERKDISGLFLSSEDLARYLQKTYPNYIVYRRDF